MSEAIYPTSTLEHNKLAQDITETRANLLSQMCVDGRENAREHQLIGEQITNTRSNLLSQMNIDG
jgi:hypothetical protein